MKLQRTNKYSNNFVKSISTIVLAGMLLTGCKAIDEVKKSDNINIVYTQEEVVEDNKEIEEIIENGSEVCIEEIEKKNPIDEYKVKYPYVNWCMCDIFVVAIRDSNNNLKILQAIGNVNGDFFEVYDLFTEEKLFAIPFKINSGFFDINENGRCINVKCKDAVKCCEYLQDKKIISLGRASYELFFKDDMNLDTDIDEDINNFHELYGDYLTFAEAFKTTQEILNNYLTYVPKEYRVSSVEMGLEPVYSEKNKFFDSWKLTDDEIEERISKLELEDRNLSVGMVNTLVLKDLNDNYKLLNVCYVEFGGYTAFYDIYTGMELFTVVGNPIFNQEKDTFQNINFGDLKNAMPYFDDKRVLYMSSAYETKKFLNSHIEEFRKRDNIDYITVPETILNISYPYRLDNMSKYWSTTRDFAKLYVRLPEDMIVSAKELGFEKGKVKVLD